MINKYSSEVKSDKSGDSLFNASLATAILYMILAMNGFRFKFYYSEQSLVFFARALSLLFYFFVTVGALFIFKPKLKSSTGLYRYKILNIGIKQWLAAAVLFILFGQTIFFNSKELLPIPWWPFVFLTGIAAFFLAMRRSVIWLLVLLFLLVNAVIIKDIVQTNAERVAPLSIGTISDACRLILDGKNPYTGDTRTPFVYLPGLMAPYILASMAKIDLRSVNLISFLLLGAFIFKAAWQRKDCLSCMVGAGTILLSAKNVQMVSYQHLPFYWLLLYLVFYLMIKRRFYLSAFFLGLTAASRQETSILVIPFAVYFFKQLGIKKMVECALISICAYSIIVLPAWFFIGNDFWYYTYLKVAKGFEINLVGAGVPFNQISLSGFLYGILGQKSLLMSQLALIFFAAFIVWKYTWKDPLKFTALCGFLFILFVSFNLVVQWYYYPTGLILISMFFLFSPKAQER